MLKIYKKVDDISNKFLIKLSLTENYINSSELTDSEIYALSYNDVGHTYTYEVPLGVTMATGYVFYKENISLYKDGVLLDVPSENFNVYVNGNLVNVGSNSGSAVYLGSSSSNS